MSTLDYSVDLVLPANMNAERSVLGAILLDLKAYDEAAAFGLTAGEMSCDSHGRIYSAMQTLAENGRPIDLVTPSNERVYFDSRTLTFHERHVPRRDKHEQ